MIPGYLSGILLLILKSSTHTGLIKQKKETQNINTTMKEYIRRRYDAKNNTNTFGETTLAVPYCMYLL
jgi:hypothetical protein